MKIGVLIPSHENVPFKFAYDLGQLAAFTAGVMPNDTEFGITGVSGTYTHTARTQLMEHALNAGLDYALWLDSDMEFPRELLYLLFEHQLPMVGINYSTREVPGHPVAVKTIFPGEYLQTTSESTGLEEVEGIGFGGVLMRMRDFQGLRDVPRPWFAQEWLPEQGDFLGEDIYFSRLVREKLGHRIFVDHDVSLMCGHTGQMTYRLQHLEAMEAA